MPNSPISNDVANAGSGFTGNPASDPNAAGITAKQGGQGVFGNQQNQYLSSGGSGHYDQYGRWVQDTIPTQYTTTTDDGGSPLITYTMPGANQNFIYANPNAYKDPNASTIYKTLAQGFNNSTDQAPQAGNTSLGSLMMLNPTQMNTASDNAFQQGQANNINQLQGLANGTGPSVAAVTADQQRQANTNAAMAMLGSQRGASNPALGLRMAMGARANADQQASAQAVAGRTQEELAGTNAVASALGTARGQAQSIATTQANIGQQAGLANQSQYNTGSLQQGTMNQQTTMQNLMTALQQGQINKQQYDQMVQAFLQQNQTDISNNVAYQQIIKDEQLGNEQINTGHQIAQQAQDTGLVGAGVSALAALGATAAAAA